MMERALKERIVGAVVLVVFVVLVVPIFLDGPPADGGTVSERVLLPGQEEQDIKTVVLDRERSVPIPAATVTVDQPMDAATKRSKPAVTTPDAVLASPVVENATDEPAAAEEVSAASTTGMWVVQLGSFSEKHNAEKLQADLRQQGYAAFVSRLTRNGVDLHRVRIGPHEDRDSAEVTAAKLLQVGHQGQVVPHP